MGIPGLTTYVYSNFLDKKKRIALQGSPIVVDGNGLLYYLYEKSNFEWQYGGQFAAFTCTAETFLNKLLIHQVQPIHLVFDGINPLRKQETLKKNRKRKLTYIIKYDEKKKAEGHYQPSIFHPLLFEAFFRFLEVYNEAHGGIIEIYCADEEADDLAVSIANTVGCPLIGNDSDYFISPLRRGYMPLSIIEWEEPGSLTGKLFCQNAFALEIGLSSDLMIAIPAIVSNDCITSLFETIFPGSKKVKVVEIVDYTIEELKEFKTVDDLKKKISQKSEFDKNLAKAHVTYSDCSPFSKENFKHCSFQDEESAKQALPAWITEQYRNSKLSKSLLEILIRKKYFLPIVPFDNEQECTVLFSRHIRQKIYGVMNLQKVSEEVYTRDQFEWQQVESTCTCMKDKFSFSTMNTAPVAVRLEELYAALLCKPCTLSSLSEQWHVVVASVCYWAKTAHLARNGLKIKALLLCFVECYQQDIGEFDPVFDRDSLHVLTQWQCVYHDAIMLNQVLALPIHYLSPASIFDGRRVTYYYQNKEYFGRHVYEVSAETLSLYKSLLEAVNSNLIAS